MHGAQHTCRAAHVELHLVHGCGGFDRNSTRVKRDAFANQDNWSFVGGLTCCLARGACAGFSLIVHDDEAGRLRRTTCHRQKGTHAKLFNLFGFEYGDFDAFKLAAEFFSGLAQVGRCADIAG